MTRSVNPSHAEIEELLEGRNSKNTSNVISMAVKIIRDYLEDKAINISVEDLENDSNDKTEFSFEEILRRAKEEKRRIIFEIFPYINQIWAACRDIF